MVVRLWEMDVQFAKRKKCVIRQVQIKSYLERIVNILELVYKWWCQQLIVTLFTDFPSCCLNLRWRSLELYQSGTHSSDLSDTTWIHNLTKAHLSLKDRIHGFSLLCDKQRCDGSLTSSGLTRRLTYPDKSVHSDKIVQHHFAHCSQSVTVLLYVHLHAVCVHACYQMSAIGINTGLE